MSSPKPITLVLYIPVLHRGYLELLNKYANPDTTLYLIGIDLIEEFSTLHTEIRALAPETVKQLIESLHLFSAVEILTREKVDELTERPVILADETLSHELADKYLKSDQVRYEKVFLRWDESAVASRTDIQADRESTDSVDQQMIAHASRQAEKSSCWWRHVGAVVVKDGQMLADGCNRHVPSEHTPYINGDPRDVIPAGTQSEFASSIHAEQSVIADAARRGIALEGASIYLTTFSCPACAKLVAYSGIKHLYFATGHASLDGLDVLRANGVEIIHVAESGK